MMERKKTTEWKLNIYQGGRDEQQKKETSFKIFDESTATAGQYLWGKGGKSIQKEEGGAKQCTKMKRKEEITIDTIVVWGKGKNSG